MYVTHKLFLICNTYVDGLQLCYSSQWGLQKSMHVLQQQPHSHVWNTYLVAVISATSLLHVNIP